MEASVKKSDFPKALFSTLVKSTVISFIYTILCVLLFAFIIKILSVGDSIIPPVNQIIKITAILISSYFAIKRVPQRRALIGAAAASAYIVAGFLIFSLIQGSMGSLSVFLTDLVMSAAMGLITGILYLRVLDSSNQKAKGKK